MKLPKPNIDADDILFLVGTGLFGYGLWCIYPPACWIAVGVIFMLLGWYRAGGK